MIKSLYFMFFVCIALWGLIACGSSSKNDFPIYPLMNLNVSSRMKMYNG